LDNTPNSTDNEGNSQQQSNETTEVTLPSIKRKVAAFSSRILGPGKLLALH